MAARLRRADLIRHPSSPDAVRGIAVRLERSPTVLSVGFDLKADLAALRIPPAGPVRAGDRLWQHTCFEVFLSARMPAYTEFNFSPSREWAGYGFSRYRERAPAPTVLPPERLAVSGTQDALSLEAVIPILQPGSLRIALSAVIEDRTGGLSYWALAHPPGKPDFHHPDAFALELDEVRN